VINEDIGLENTKIVGQIESTDVAKATRHRPGLCLAISICLQRSLEGRKCDAAAGQVVRRPCTRFSVISKGEL
jgi:hypothetical protein